MPVPDSRRLTGRRVECGDVSSSTLPPPRLLCHAGLSPSPSMASGGRPEASRRIRPRRPATAVRESRLLFWLRYERGSPTAKAWRLNESLS
jgi:hypothetical protein